MADKLQNKRGRGGARAGAGRPKAVPPPKTAIEQEIESGIQAEFVALARSYSTTALKVLGLIATQGKSETARVSAAAKIIEFAALADADEALTPEGKKAQAKQSAERLMSGGGKFSAPSSPPSLVSKTVQ